MNEEPFNKTLPLLYFGSSGEKKSILCSSGAKKDQKEKLTVSTETFNRGQGGTSDLGSVSLVDFKQPLSKWNKLERDSSFLL